MLMRAVGTQKKTLAVTVVLASASADVGPVAERLKHWSYLVDSEDRVVFFFKTAAPRAGVRVYEAAKHEALRDGQVTAGKSLREQIEYDRGDPIPTSSR
jgi:hypothetical protein